MPIINPWVFYLISLLGNLSLLLEGVLTIMFVILIVISIIFIWNKVGETTNLMDYGVEDKDYLKYSKLCKQYFKFMKNIAIAVVICSIVSVFIPSKETMYTMMVANVTTYENVDKATDVIKDGVDYIFDKFDDDKDGDK